MALTFENRQQQPVGGNQYLVEIQDIELPFGIDEISGLGLGRINTVPHRRSGSLDLHKQNYPVGIETPEVTFTGLYAYNFSDIDRLANWHKECTGIVTNLETGLLTIKRSIIIKPVFRDYAGNVIEPDDQPGQWLLLGCLCTDLNISNFATDGANFSQWTMSVKPDKVDLILGGGE